MRTSAIAFVLVAAVCVGNAMAAEEAEDIVIHLAATKKPAVYRVGEQIEFDGVVSGKGSGHCLVDDASDGLRDREWRQSQDEFHVVRVGRGAPDRTATYDPYFDQREFDPSMIHMIIKLTGLPSLTKPRSMHFVLNEWVRITCPGEYRVTVETKRILR